jgi:hypothetical protein
MQVGTTATPKTTADFSNVTAIGPVLLYPM